MQAGPDTYWSKVKLLTLLEVYLINTTKNNLYYPHPVFYQISCTEIMFTRHTECKTRCCLQKMDEGNHHKVWMTWFRVANNKMCVSYTLQR